MAKIKGEVDTTPKQEATLNAIFLPEINAARAAQGLPPLATMDEYADWLLGAAMPDWVGKSNEKKAKDTGDKYKDADPAVQAEIDALLN